MTDDVVRRGKSRGVWGDRSILDPRCISVRVAILFGRRLRDGSMRPRKCGGQRRQTLDPADGNSPRSSSKRPEKTKKQGDRKDPVGNSRRYRDPRENISLCPEDRTCVLTGIRCAQLNWPCCPTTVRNSPRRHIRGWKRRGGHTAEVPGSEASH